MDLVLSPEQRQKIEKLISRVSDGEGIDEWEARTLIHKCICGGRCGWYKTWGGRAGFDRSSVPVKQRKHVEEIIGRIMKDVTMREARALIHEFICPGHPRSSE